MDTKERCERLRQVATGLQIVAKAIYANPDDPRSVCEHLGNKIPECAHVAGLAEYLGLDSELLPRTGLFGNLETRLLAVLFPLTLHGEMAERASCVLLMMAHILEDWESLKSMSNGVCGEERMATRTAIDLLENRYDELLCPDDD